MIEVQNGQLLQSQQALQELSAKSLPGLQALALREIISDVEERMQRLQEVQQELMEREDDAQEEWEDVLQDTLELDEEPLPEEAIEGIEISAGTLMALDWLIEG